MDSSTEAKQDLVPWWPISGISGGFKGCCDLFGPSRRCGLHSSSGLERWVSWDGRYFWQRKKLCQQTTINRKHVSYDLNNKNHHLYSLQNGKNMECILFPTPSATWDSWIAAQAIPSSGLWAKSWHVEVFSGMVSRRLNRLSKRTWCEESRRGSMCLKSTLEQDWEPIHILCHSPLGFRADRNQPQCSPFPRKHYLALDSCPIDSSRAAILTDKV